MEQKTVRIGVYSYSERELAQIVRRKMITRECKNKKKYNRNANKQALCEARRFANKKEARKSLLYLLYIVYKAI